jgi:hypothetical protein
VAFKLRTLRTFSVQRLVAALILVAFVPIAHEADAWVTIAVVGAVLWGMLAFEMVRYAEARRHVRHADHVLHQPD